MPLSLIEGQVEGFDAVGSTPNGKPVLSGGVDSSNAVRIIQMDALGRPVASPLGQLSTTIKTHTFEITTRAETVLSALNYTVTSGKDLYLTFFGGSVFAPLPIILRLKVGGVTAVMVVAGTTASNISLMHPFKIATSGNAITVTVEAQVPRGHAWVSFAAIEV